jgi:hypothetical protein
VQIRNIEELRHHGAGDAVPLAMFGTAQNPDYWRAADELGFSRHANPSPSSSEPASTRSSV